jgi:fructose-bisphosphate aldolase class I
MITTDLAAVASALVSGGRGIVPLDAPPAVANTQFALLGIPRSEASRGAFRELAVTAPELERYAGGVLLEREAFRQRGPRGRRLVEILADRGILPGIALFAPSSALAGSPAESVVEGLDGLRGRLTEFAALGARFAELRATFRIGVGGTPSDRAIAANAHALARFAALAQDARIVPVVVAEVDPDGAHDLARGADAMERILRALIAELAASRVALDALVLQPTMVTPGTCAKHAEPADVVAATLRVLGVTVPVAVAGIAFAAGGDERDATEQLCAMNRTMPRRRPWPLTFAYGADLREAALAAWRGRAERAVETQRVLIERARSSGLAACGAAAPMREPREAVPAAA